MERESRILTHPKDSWLFQNWELALRSKQLRKTQKTENPATVI